MEMGRGWGTEGLEWGSLVRRVEGGLGWATERTPRWVSGRGCVTEGRPQDMKWGGARP